MEDLKFTPGPWEKSEYIHETPVAHKASYKYSMIYHYSGPIRRHLADVYGLDEQEIKDTAELISKAPDMYSALLKAKKAMEPYNNGEDLKLAEAISEINKVLES